MEGYRSSTYGDAFADVYDEWYPANAETEQAVAGLRRLAGTGPVLELGCGTGRLCLPLAASGLEVVGLDASEAMLRRLRAKPGADRLALVAADMADFDLARPGPAAAGGPEGAAGADRPSRFRLVFAAFNTLFNLPTAEQQAACFRAVARHLADDGCFAIECFVPADDGDDAGGGPPGTDGAGPAGRAGRAVRDVIELRALSAERVVLRVSRQDVANQTVSGQHIELTEAAGVRLRPWHLRYAGPAELDDLAAAAGLELAARWRSWTGEPFGEDATQHVSLYRPRR